MRRSRERVEFEVRNARAKRLEKVKHGEDKEIF